MPVLTKDRLGSGTNGLDFSSNDQIWVIKAGISVESDLAHGVASASALSNSTLINNGTIIADGASGGVTGFAYGVAMFSNNAHVINSTSGVIAAESSGVYSNGHHFILQNSGNITGLKYDGVDAFGDNSNIINSETGVIFGARYGVNLDSLYGSIFNHGLIAVGDQNGLAGTAIRISANCYIENYGAINGRITSDEGTTVVINWGTLSSVSYGSNSSYSDYLRNHGNIVGGVTLGDGGDSYNGRGDSVVGSNVYGGPGDDILIGGRNDDEFSGGAGKDWITGNKGDDILTGDGGEDRFIFKGHFGEDEIMDFAAIGANHDIISFSHNTFTGFADVKSSMIAMGNDTLIVLDAENSVLVHVKMADFTTVDFVFT